MPAWALIPAMAFAAFIDSHPQPQDPFQDPGYCKLVWVQSPNFNERPQGTIVDTIVLHHTAQPSLRSTVEWFSNPESRVSAHFTVGKDGSIVQHVSTFQRAWHAGESRDIEGRSNVNDFSIGIEIANAGDGIDKFTEQQINVVGFLIGALKHRFPNLKYVTSHEYVAIPAGRKIDPKDFPWDRLNYLKLKLVFGKQTPTSKFYRAGS